MISRFARRAVAVASTVAGLTLLLATPALADVPQGWSNPKPVSAIDWLLVILIIPVSLAAVIVLIVAGPGLLKGKGLTGGQQAPAAGMSSERPEGH